MILLFSFCLTALSSRAAEDAQAWIRINQLGYLPEGIKVGVWVGKQGTAAPSFQLLEAKTSTVVFTGKTGRSYGAYGPFSQSYRLNFSAFNEPGSYYIKCGKVVSPVFRLANDIYEGTADFSLRYMRQQRSGFNPFLKDSCHTKDGFTKYGPMPDSTHIDVSGGWHDASDYLQYVTTSANATYHLLAAYRDFPGVFADGYQANGLEGSNGAADVLDEAKWGLTWLLKMHPKKNWMFNQLADDRDHAGMRLPAKDLVDYGMGKGNGRVVYFANGKLQGLGNYKNRSTGVASTAGKFASAFALASSLYKKTDPALARLFQKKSISAYNLGLAKPGVSQTAPNREPYFYEEDNWVDDMELASAALFKLTGEQKYLKQSLQYSSAEQVTPWMGADTARHYQWYPFHNFGHNELAAVTDRKNKAALISYYRQGIEKVMNKAQHNAFYRGVPFIWCSNNLTASFAIQCALYRKLSGDQHYAELEQACIDWLFGSNPWGKCMVYGMPAMGDTPKDPHSSLSHLYHYPLDGGLVDGPVYGSIFKSLRGLTLSKPDEYAEFQSDLVVYHDDNGDYSTNEPTMDGTASLVYLLAGKAYEARQNKSFIEAHGAIIRGDTSSKKLALVFTGDEFGDGAAFIANALKQEQVHGSFFLTGNFYRNKHLKKVIGQLKADGNYLGSHSDRHLLYCDWGKRDSLLVNRSQFEKDITAGYAELQKFGIDKKQAPYFLPPYEWYNDTIAAWTRDVGLQLVNFTPGTRSNADYTYPEMGQKYVDSEKVLASILNYGQKDKNGLNGFILLVHIGTDPRRTDKFYARLPQLIPALKSKGYQFVRIDELLKQEPDSIPATWLKDSLPQLVNKCKILLDHAYMAQELISETDTLPGWEGFPVKLYTYKTGKDLYTGQPKTGKVYLLNPSAEKLATWIMTTCWEVKKSVDAKYINKVFETIRGQSGAQFPVKGVVYEDQYTRNFQEPYVFKDGVTVYVADSTMFPKDKTCTPEQLDFYLRIQNKDLKPQTGRYGRIISTNREMYIGNGGTAAVGDAENRKMEWLNVVKELYKKAWRSDKNELMIAWARQNL